MHFVNDFFLNCTHYLCTKSYALSVIIVCTSVIIFASCNLHAVEDDIKSFNSKIVIKSGCGHHTKNGCGMYCIHIKTLILGHLYLKFKPTS